MHQDLLNDHWIFYAGNDPYLINLPMLPELKKNADGSLT